MQKRKENKSMTVRDGGFLQSNDWINFQESFGRKVFRQSKENYFRCNAIENQLPFVGSYLFIPRGPIFLEQEGVTQCLEKLVEMARQNDSAWVRVEPQNKDGLELIDEFTRKRGLTFKKAKKDHQPAQTIMLDITNSEKELLARMKPKTRYNIKLANKKGVKVSVDHSKEAQKAFIELSQETAKRDKIAIHPAKYYYKMLSVIAEDKLSLYVARYQNRIIAASLVSFCNSVATYLHGASANQNRNVMAPYLLQWSAICDAKKRGFSRYDFGGTKLESSEDGGLKKNDWSGITRFKLGFSPKEEPVEFPGCWDIVISKRKYYTYKVLQNIKDVLRRLKVK